MDNDISIQSPVRLLQKLIAYRESISSTTTSSSQTERKSTILSESTKFFTRLWRLHDSNAKPSETLMISRETTSSSFDHISELSPTFVDTTLTLPPSSKSNRRMSFIRDISLKNSPQSPTLSPSLLIESSLPFQSQSPTLNTITNQSFNDISPEHRARKLYSQNLETNIDNSHLKTLNERQTPQEQQELINKKRDHHLNLSTTSFIPSVQKLSSLSMQRTDEHRASFTSPEANIDVSKVSWIERNEILLNICQQQAKLLFSAKYIYIYICKNISFHSTSNPIVFTCYHLFFGFLYIRKKLNKTSLYIQTLSTFKNYNDSFFSLFYNE